MKFRKFEGGSWSVYYHGRVFLGGGDLYFLGGGGELHRCK